MTAVDLSAVVQHLVDELVALGVDATADPAAVVIPGAWVTVRRINPRTAIDGSADVELVAYLLAGDYAVPEVLDELALLLEVVLDLAAPGQPVEALTLALPNYAPQGLPALAVPVHVEVTP